MLNTATVIEAAAAEVEAPKGTYPVGPFTVVTNCEVVPFPVQYDRLADAALCVAARRQNAAYATHSVLDADGFIVGRAWLESGLAIKKAEAEYNLNIIAAGL